MRTVTKNYSGAKRGVVIDPRDHLRVKLGGLNLPGLLWLKACNDTQGKVDPATWGEVTVQVEDQVHDICAEL